MLDPIFKPGNLLQLTSKQPSYYLSCITLAASRSGRRPRQCFSPDFLLLLFCCSSTCGRMVRPCFWHDKLCRIKYNCWSTHSNDNNNVTHCLIYPNRSSSSQQTYILYIINAYMTIRCEHETWETILYFIIMVIKHWKYTYQHGYRGFSRYIGLVHCARHGRIGVYGLLLLIIIEWPFVLCKLWIVWTGHSALAVVCNMCSCRRRQCMDRVTNTCSTMPIVYRNICVV